MPYTFTLTSKFPASARQVYDTWLDSAGHSEMTGGAAIMSDVIGAEVSAWDGYINGRNLDLIPGERIVQSWRTTEFTERHEDSTITVTLQDMRDGSLLTLVHSNVPDDQTSYEESGWQSHYFEPMQSYFATRRQRSNKASRRAAKKTKRAAKRAKTAAPKRKLKTKRAAAGPKGKHVKKPIKRKHGRSR